MIAVRVVGSLSTGILTVVLGRLLGPHDYGFYALCMTIGSATVAVADQGIPSATNRFISERYPNLGAMRSAFLVGLRAKTVAALLAATLLFVLAQPIADLIHAPNRVGLIRVVAVAVAVQDLYSLLGGSFIAFRRTAGSAVIALTKAVVEFAAAIGLVLTGLGAAGAVVGNVAGYILADSLGICFLLVATRSARYDDGASVQMRGLIRYGRQVWYAEVVFAGFAFIDQFLLQALADTRALGIYAVAWRMMVPLQHIAIAFSLVLTTRLATLDRVEAGEVFERGLRALTALYVGGGVLCVVLAQPLLLALLGAEFERSGTVFAALVPLVVMLGLGPLLTGTLNVLGGAKARKWVSIGTLILNVVGDVILIPRYGVLGPAIASDIAYIAYVGGHLYLCRRIVSFRLRAIARSAILGAQAGAFGAVGILLLLALPFGPVTARALVAPAVGLPMLIIGLIAMQEFDGSLLNLVRR